MDPVPWRAEVILTPDLVGEILRRQFPALHIRNVDYLNEGWDSFAFLADGRWVFLFPKRRETEQSYLASMRLLEELYDCMPLPVPRPEYWGRSSEAFPFQFAGYRFLPGLHGDRTPIPRQQQLPNARRLGEFLYALHSFPVDRALALGIRRSTCDHAEELLDEVRHLADRLADRLPAALRDRCLPFLDGTAERPPPPDGRCCLTHGDLQAEHILLDGEAAVCGIIDFGDASIAEPGGDYVGLCAWQGWDFARAALAAAGVNVDGTMEKRILFMARCLGLIGVGWANWQDQDRLSPYQRFLRNAFEE